MPDAAVLSIFGTSFLVGLSGAVSPGPLLAYNIRETVRRGFLAGPYVATGHAILELLVVVVLALGLSRFIDVDNVTGAIGLLGGLVLLWMAAVCYETRGKERLAQPNIALPSFTPAPRRPSSAAPWSA